MSVLTLLKRKPGVRKWSGAYLGYRGYAVILAILKRPGTSDHVAATTGAGAQGMRVLLKQFNALRLIHRVGWVHPKSGFPAPIYKLGEGEDAPAPLTADGRPMPHCGHRPALRRNVVAFASLIHAMADESRATKLAVESGMSESRMRELLAFMRKPEIKLIHIAAYDPGGRLGGKAAALYQYAPDTRDAQPPRPQQRQREKQRDFRRRDIVRDQWSQTVLGLKRIAGIVQPRA